MDRDVARNTEIARLTPQDLSFPGTDREHALRIAESIDIRYGSSAAAIEEVLGAGYEPVECSFGGTSIVGKYKLDHHGKLSSEEPVSVKAARLALEPGFEPLHKFAVTGMADGDATYAILALSQTITPSIEIAAGLAELDMDPIGIDRTVHPYIREVIFEMNGIPELSKEGFYNALAAGATAFDGGPLSQDLRDSGIEYERKRLERGREAIKDIANDVALVEFDGPSRDVWHQYASLVVQYKPTQSVITISSCSPRAAGRLGKKSAFDIFGAGGLGEFYPVLDRVLGSAGSGGRPDIGGSPRGVETTWSDAVRVFECLAQMKLQ